MIEINMMLVLSIYMECTASLFFLIRMGDQNGLETTFSQGARDETGHWDQATSSPGSLSLCSWVSCPECHRVLTTRLDSFFGTDIVTPVTLSLVKMFSNLHERKEGYLSRILCSGGYTGIKTHPWGFKSPRRSRVSGYIWKQVKRDEPVVFDLWSASSSLTHSPRKVSACLAPILVCLWGSRLPSSMEWAQRLIQDQL